MRGTRFLIYLTAAVLLILAAGCGWESGESFQGEFNPEGTSPIDTVQKWFASMEFLKSANEEGEMVRNPENGRDFDLYLQVVNPELLQDPNGEFIGTEQVETLRETWNSDQWWVEFKNIQLEEASISPGEEATVAIVGGDIRYSGQEMFGTPEYKQDSFEDKRGEIYLQWYDDPVNDPLLNIPGFEEIAGKGRWVVTRGFDLSEDEPWPPEDTET